MSVLKYTFPEMIESLIEMESGMTGDEHGHKDVEIG